MSTEIKRKFDALACRDIINRLEGTLEIAKPNVRDELEIVKNDIVNICKPTSKKEVLDLLHATSVGRMDKDGDFMMAAGFPWNPTCKPGGKVIQKKVRDGNEIFLACQSDSKPKRPGVRKAEVDNMMIAAVRFHPDMYEVRKIRGKDEYKISRKPPQGSAGKPEESTWIQKFGPLVYDDGYMRFKDIAEARQKGNFEDLHMNIKPKYFL